MDPLRLAVLATTRNPLREPFAGGQESLTATLIQALRARGHHVRLYAAAGTDPELADEVIGYPQLPPLSVAASADVQLPEPDFLRDHHNLLAAVADLQYGEPVDLIHNQSLHHLPLAMSRALAAPVVTTLHTPPLPWMEVGISLADPRCRYAAVSAFTGAQWTTLAHPAEVILNGVDVSRFDAGPGGEELVWFGRLVPEKAPELAVRAARMAGRPLRLAGPIPDPEWFAYALAPLLGGDICYLGHLTHAEANQLLGRSAALLMTPRWDEPFGLVAVEAALTGTPTVAIGRGGLAEVVQPGLGVCVPMSRHDAKQARFLARAVDQAVQLSRTGVRHLAMSRFGAERLCRDYETLFAATLADSLVPRTPERLGAGAGLGPREGLSPREGVGARRYADA